MSFSASRARVGAVLVFFGLATTAGAQVDSVLVTKNFKFEDGLYVTVAEFQQNRPAIPWKDVKAILASNPQTFLIQVESLYSSGTGPIAPDSLWGLCLGGIPYIRLQPEAVDKPLPTFAGLRVRGRICYFEYQRDTVLAREMAAYNPLTGKPFRKGKVDMKATLEFKCMLDFDSGKTAPFDLPHFLEWIAGDDRLYQTYAEMDPALAAEKLFKGLLIYLDRNPLFIKQIPTTEP